MKYGILGGFIAFRRMRNRARSGRVRIDLGRNLMYTAKCRASAATLPATGQAGRTGRGKPKQSVQSETEKQRRFVQC